MIQNRRDLIEAAKNLLKVIRAEDVRRATDLMDDFERDVAHLLRPWVRLDKGSRQAPRIGAEVIGMDTGTFGHTKYMLRSGLNLLIAGDSKSAIAVAERALVQLEADDRR